MVQAVTGGVLYQFAIHISYFPPSGARAYQPLGREHCSRTLGHNMLGHNVDGGCTRVMNIRDDSSESADMDVIRGSSIMIIHGIGTNCNFTDSLK